MHERRISLDCGGTASPARQHRWRRPRARARSGSAAAGTKHVAIVNKDMTDDEIKAAIAAEGSLTVGNWTYSANDELVNQFQKYVKDTYGADIKLTYVGSQQPSEYLTKLAADQKAGNPARFDVIAVEENYWDDASHQGLVDDVLASDLIPNQSWSSTSSSTRRQSIAFQSTAYPGVVYNKNDAGYLTKLKDLADPRLKGKLTLPPADRHHRRRPPPRPRLRDGQGLQGPRADEGGRGLGGPEPRPQRPEVHDRPGRRRSSCSSRARSTRSGSGTASPGWNTWAATRRRRCSCRPTIYPANGYLWVPKGAQHPVLAQVFMNWRLAKDVQFPNAWPIDHGQWSELSEGFLGPDYVDQIPDWFTTDYYTYFPKLDQIKIGVQDDRLGGLQRQLEDLPRLLRPAAWPVGHADAQDMARPPATAGEPIHPRHRGRSWSLNACRCRSGSRPSSGGGSATPA